MLDEDETTEVDSAPEGDASPENDTAAPSPWDERLSKYPDAIREQVLDGMKYVEGLTTKKFQEAADFRKQAEPYMGIQGLTDWQPEELTQGLDLLQRLMDEEQAPELVRSLAEHYGLQLADDGEDWDDDDPEDEDGDPDFDSRIDERVKPLQEYVEQQQQREREREAHQQISSTFEEIEKQAGRKVGEDEREQVLTIAQGLIGKSDNPIKAGWDAYTQIVERAQKGLVTQKRREPGQAEVGPSNPDGTPQPSTSFEDAKDEVAAYLKARAA